MDGPGGMATGRTVLKRRSRASEGERGGTLSGLVIRGRQPGVGKSAGEGAHRRREHALPLGGRVYDLRHACLTTWLNNGVPPAQVAEWAGVGNG
jgi:hypothetical protein